MFDIEKNKKRAIFFAKLLANLKSPEAVAGIYTFEYGNETLHATFLSIEKPFTEEYNGKMKTRKGFTMAGIYDNEANEGGPIAVGFSVCSDKDEWNLNRGVVNAFVDAINFLSYTDKKRCIDDNWGELLANADKNMRKIRLY